MVRLKRRYALCEVIYTRSSHHGREVTNVTDHALFKAIKKALLDTHGDLGFASLRPSLSVKYANPDTNIVIIRGSRQYFDMVMSSIVFISKIGEHEAFLSTLYIGASIRCCQKFIIKYHKRNLPLLYPNCSTEEEREEIIQSIIDSCEKLESVKPPPSSSQTEPNVSNLQMIIDSGEQIS